MAFYVRVLFFTAVVYVCKSESPLGHDSYTSSALHAPSASYGPPSPSYGPPSTSYGTPFSSGSLNLAQNLPPPPGSFYGAPSNDQDGSLNLDETRPPVAPPVGPPVSTGSLNLGEPRVIGSTVQVGRPIASATRYELQSVVQNVVRRIPIEVVRHVQVAVPQPVPVPVRQEVKVPVPQPYPVQVEVARQVPYDVYQTQNVEVERPVPYEVVRKVPVHVIRKVPVPVDRPYEVIRKVHVPIEKHVHVPVAIWKPYPIHIIKHVTHYQKKKCCW